MNIIIQGESQHKMTRKSKFTAQSFSRVIMKKKITKACILERRITLVRPYSRNKSKFTDLIFPVMFCKLVTS